MTTNPHTGNLCPHWVFSNNSNVHVAKDREWFTDYTPFESSVGSLYFQGPKSAVKGVGTVRLLTKKHPKRMGQANHGVLVLKNVLHVPDFNFNLVGGPILADCSLTFEGTAARVRDKRGQNVGYFETNGRKLYELKLRGPRVGPSTFERDTSYVLNARWDASEMARWEEFKATRLGPIVTTGVAIVVGSDSDEPSASPAAPPYTAEEMAWLKKNYGSEYHFLLTMGLKIFKDEDREEGRRIVRAMMADDESDDDKMEDSDSEEDSFLRELEETPEAHMADYHFTAKELDWIGKNYGHSFNFMMSHGLKFYDDDDCDEAKAIVRAFM